MLECCVDQCPNANWQAPIANLKFCQAVFHALIFTDLYLGADETSLRAQPFHRDHGAVFGDYEEFEDRAQQQTYQKPFIQKYLEHCRNKARQVVSSETAATLVKTSGFARKDFSRAELHVCNIRHLQHHAAQLSLRLRIDSDLSVLWTSS